MRRAISKIKLQPQPALISAALRTLTSKLPAKTPPARSTTLPTLASTQPSWKTCPNAATRVQPRCKNTPSQTSSKSATWWRAHKPVAAKPPPSSYLWYTCCLSVASTGRSPLKAALRYSHRTCLWSRRRVSWPCRRRTSRASTRREQGWRVLWPTAELSTTSSWPIYGRAVIFWLPRRAGCLIMWRNTLLDLIRLV